MLQAVKQQAPVGQTGNGIMQGKMRDCPLGGLALCEVDGDQRPFALAERGTGGKEMPVSTVNPAYFVFTRDAAGCVRDVGLEEKRVERDSRGEIVTGRPDIMQKRIVGVDDARAVAKTYAEHVGGIDGLETTGGDSLFHRMLARHKAHAASSSSV